MKKFILGTIIVTSFCVSTASMAQLKLAFGHLNESFYVSSGSTDAQFTVTTAPALSITGGGIAGGVSSGTVISSSYGNPTSAILGLWMGGTPTAAIATLTYTATVGTHPAISGSLTNVEITAQADGSISVSNTIKPTVAWSSDNLAACEASITQPSDKKGASYPTFTLNCGDMSSLKK